MPDHDHPEPPFWISDKDERGQPLHAEVLAAAGRIWRRVLALTRFSLNDVSRAAEILEAIAAAVSRALRRRRAEPAVRDVDSYLLYAFARRLHKIAVKERRFQSGHSSDMLAHLAAATGRTLQDLEAEIQVQELMSFMDDNTRRMFSLRLQGYSWKEIAQRLGFKSRHSAEVQFNKGCRAARQRMTRVSKPADSRGRD